MVSVFSAVAWRRSLHRPGVMTPNEPQIHGDWRCAKTVDCNPQASLDSFKQRQWCIADFAHGITPCTMDSSSLGARHRDITGNKSLRKMAAGK